MSDAPNCSEELVARAYDVDGDLVADVYTFEAVAALQEAWYIEVEYVDEYKGMVTDE